MLGIAFVCIRYNYATLAKLDRTLYLNDKLHIILLCIFILIRIFGVLQ